VKTKDPEWADFWYWRLFVASVGLFGRLIVGRIRWVKITKLATLTLFALVFVRSQALSANDPPLPSSAMADKVVVLKGYRRLLLMKGDEILKTYIVSLGGNPIGPKIRQGDNKTPEGNYLLDRHNANSQYHRSIHISYPNADDLARARRLGVPPGGELFIHGLPNDFHGDSEALGDWTEGCIALSNAEMDEIWRAVADGTPIEIKP
jgi:murein L,D-transpeptidase YafK